VCPLIQCHVPTDTVPCAHWYSAVRPLIQCCAPTDTVPCAHWHSAMCPLTVISAMYPLTLISAMYPVIQCHVPTGTVPCNHWHSAIYQKTWILRNCVLRISHLVCVICSSRNTSDLYSARIQYQYQSAYLLFCIRYREVYCSSLWHRSWLDHLLPHAFQFIIGCHPVIQFCIVWVTGR